MSADIRLTNNNVDAIGNLSIRQRDDMPPSVKFYPSDGRLELGGNNRDGNLKIRRSTGAETIRMDGNSGNLTMGSNGIAGDIILKDSSGTNMIKLNAYDANIYMGGKGQDGDIIMRNQKDQQAIHINADGASITCGGNGTSGSVNVFSENGPHLSQVAPGLIYVNGTGDFTGVVVGSADNKVVTLRDGEVTIRRGNESINVFETLNRLQAQIDELQRR